MKRTLAGIWHNQNGSELELEVSSDGRISGKFRSATGLAKGATSDVTGFIKGDLVTFAANLGEHDSLTAWTGHVIVEGGETRIQTQWHMAVALPAKQAAEDLWKGVWTGADSFRRGASKLDRPTSPNAEDSLRIRPS